ASMGGGEPPRSVRDAGVQPWHLRLGPDALAAGLPAVGEAGAAAPGAGGRGGVGAEAPAVGAGRLAVLVPAGRAEEAAEALAPTLSAATTGQGPSVLGRPVAVLTVTEAKGLEFDAVVVIDPAAILAASVRGPSDLYVALTRATARLAAVHPGAPPRARAGPVAPGQGRREGGQLPGPLEQPGVALGVGLPGRLGLVLDGAADHVVADRQDGPQGLVGREAERHQAAQDLLDAGQGGLGGPVPGDDQGGVALGGEGPPLEPGPLGQPLPPPLPA